MITHRRRDSDVQSQLADAAAVVDYLRRLPYVDADSIVIYGCSSGGDLALAVASVRDVAALIAEEPTSPIFMRVATNELMSSQGTALELLRDPLRYYTPEARSTARARIDGIRATILILQGDIPTPIDVKNFNERVLIPELRAAGKSVEVTIYPSAPHCFAFTSPGSQRALNAIQNAEHFLRQHVRVEPKPIGR